MSAPSPSQKDGQQVLKYAFDDSTGNARIPGIANVKTGFAYDTLDSLTGTYDGSDRWTDPGTANVRLGTAYKANSTTNNETGLAAIPTAGNVKIGVATDQTVGTYDGSDRWTDPGSTNVRLSTVYKANSLTNNETGSLDIPQVANVLTGVVYDNTTKTGTLSIAASVWNATTASYTTAGSFGVLMKALLTLGQFLGLK